MEKQILLQVEDLSTSFLVGRQSIRIIKNASFPVYRSRTLAIVGESGCGKSVTVHSILQLLPKNGRQTGGAITYYKDGQPLVLSAMKRNGPEMRALRGQEIGMIFQDPMSSLNPVYKVGYQVAENLRIHRGVGKQEARRAVVEMFARLGIPDPDKRYDAYPHEFSGGMKQRVMIAIAMICNPQLLIADEPTTALDVTIQAQIMELMKSIQQDEGKSIVLITHNMGLVADMADNVAVMYMGRVMEYGTAEDIFLRPAHPYTRALMRSVPVIGDRSKRLDTIPGITPNPAELGEGCEFANRCEYACAACSGQAIGEREIAPGHRVRCLRAVEEGGNTGDA